MKTKKPRKFFIKYDGDIAIVKLDYFKTISREHAVIIALETYLEIQRQLAIDALNDDEGYIGSIKVTDGLERSLVELERNHPHVMTQVHALDKICDGSRVYSA